jgi:hypothetical protein
MYSPHELRCLYTGISECIADDCLGASSPAAMRATQGAIQRILGEGPERQFYDEDSDLIRALRGRPPRSMESSQRRSRRRGPAGPGRSRMMTLEDTDTDEDMIDW